MVALLEAIGYVTQSPRSGRQLAVDEVRSYNHAKDGPVETEPRKVILKQFGDWINKKVKKQATETKH